MKFLFQCLDMETGEAACLGITNNPDQAAQVIETASRLFLEEGGAPPRPSAPFIKGRPGPKGRKVFVQGVSEEYDGPVKSGDLFDTALDASIALGFTHNAVAQALNMAARRGEDTATVRGVELRFADTMVHD